MILYLDASALAKQYLTNEIGASEVKRLIAEAHRQATALISRAEVSAALAKAVRLDWIRQDEGLSILAEFRRDWPKLFRLPIREATVVRADQLAWQFGLRGNDSVHLASAVLWQESLGESVILATFDAALWRAASQAGLQAWPEQLP